MPTAPVLLRPSADADVPAIAAIYAFHVRHGTGKVIEKETDLPADQRWPDYRALPAPADSDGDGLPDFWEKQFGLDPNDAKDSAKISAGGYANITILGITEDVIAHLHDHGVMIELGPVPRTGALGPIRSVYCRDPDGNLVEIASYLPL